MKPSRSPETSDWPLPGRPMAWGVAPRFDLTAVPLPQAVLDRGQISAREYRGVMASRLAWLLRQEDMELRADLLRRLGRGLQEIGGLARSLEASDLTLEWGPFRLIADNPAVLTVLGQTVALPPFPAPVRNLPPAIEAMQTLPAAEMIEALLFQPQD